MVEWTLFAVSRNISNASLPCNHFKSLSSINLSHENAMYPLQVFVVYKPKP